MSILVLDAEALTWILVVGVRALFHPECTWSGDFGWRLAGRAFGNGICT